MTKILRCNCVHAFQDERYGKGNRVMNLTQVKPEGTVYRCTVCGKEKHVGQE